MKWRYGPRDLWTDGPKDTPSYKDIQKYKIIFWLSLYLIYSRDSYLILKELFYSIISKFHVKFHQCIRVFIHSDLVIEKVWCKHDFFVQAFTKRFKGTVGSV